MKLRVLDLFSGIGGFSLGLERTGGFETVAFCEIEEFPRRVLAKHWPEVPCYNDVHAIDRIGCDVVTGGYPCQAFSTAARGHHTAADLWPAMLAIITRESPQFVIAENVSEKAIRRSAREMQSLGYGCYVRRISANDAGADHQRDRWWAIAYSDMHSELSSFINAEVAKLPSLCRGLWGAGNYARAIRILDGVSDRLDRVKALGNAVVPQIPELIGRAILEAIASERAAA